MGDTVTATWNNTAGGDNNSDTISSVTVDFSQFGGGAAVAAANSAGTWTATYTLTSGVINSSNLNVSVSAADNAANSTTTADSSNATVDTVVPTVTITSNDSALKAGDVATLTFTLSESSSDFAVGDITVTGGSLSGFAGSGTSYSASFTPTASSTTGATVDVAGSTFTDAAGNANSAATQLTMTVDTVVPTVTITSNDSALKAGDVATLTFTLSESSSDFAVGDITVTGGSLSGFAGSGTSYSASFTPTASSTTGATVDVVAGSFTDGSGNGNSAATQLVMSVDTAAPTVTDGNISLSGATGTGGAYKLSDTITASWNNSAGGDNNGDISAVTVDFSAFGGGVVNASNSSNIWSASYTLSAGTIDSLNLNISVTATDNAGNITTTADSSNATVDNQVPVVNDGNISLSGATGTAGTFKVADTVTATWNNSAAGDNNSDISSVTIDFSAFGGGTAVAATNSANSWSATFTVTEDGGGTIEASNLNVIATVTDDAGNNAVTADSSNASLDNNSPGTATGTLSVAENAANGTSVGSVSAVDASSYGLTDDAAGRFAIDSVSGAVTVANGTLLNFEASSSHNITVQATDAAGNTFDTILSVSLSNVNEAPVLASNAGLTLNEGAQATISTALLNVTDVDNSTTEITFTLSAVPLNGLLQLNASTLNIGSTFTQNDISNNLLSYTHNGGETIADSFNFTVSDGGGGGITGTSFVITVIAQNDAPVIAGLSGDSLSYRTADPLVLLDSASDASITDEDSTDFDNGMLTVSIAVNRDSSEDLLLIDTAGDVSLSSGMTVGSMVLVSSTPVGSIATNGSGAGTDDLIINFDQASGNATLANITTLIQAIAYQNSDTVSVTENSRTIRFVLNDGDGSNSLDNDVTVSVVQNRLPTATDSTITASEDISYSFSSEDFGYSDPDSDPIAQIRITSLPAVGSLSLNTLPVAINDVILAADIANLSYSTAASNDNGTAYSSFTYQVHDGIAYAAADNTLTIDVNAVNDQPLISSTALTSVDEDVLYSYSFAASDVDVTDTLTYSAPTLPSWLVFNVSSGLLSGTPGNAEVGNHSVVLQVNDGSVDVQQSFTIAVANTNDAPSVSAPALTSVNEDSLYSYTHVATDVDVGDSLTYSAPTLPAWLSFDGATQVLSGTPGNADVGSHPVVLRVNDGTVNVDSSFTLVVVNTNDAPVLTGTPVTRATEGVEYGFTIAATDEDLGDTLSYVISNNPAWLGINASSGVVSGTPGNGDIGSATGILVGVSDGTVTVNLSAFDITIIGDLDGDTIADDMDSDIDGDGMDNDFETENGLDPRNDQDATGDLDGDGISNLDEFLANSNPNADDYGPLLTPPADITVNATGLFTEVDLGEATAIDGLDGSLTAVDDSEGKRFAPGINVVVWNATDNAGNTTTAMQLVNVIPLVDFSKDQTVAEDIGTVTLKVILNGSAVSYPVTVPYTLSGSATAIDDHNAVSGTATIESGTETSISFDVVNDGIGGEPVETVVFTMGEPSNAVKGPHKTHSVELVEGNVAPQVTLSSTQSNMLTRTVEQGSADVVVTAQVIDTNTSDTHQYDWSATDNALVDLSPAVADSFTFTPSSVGLYTLRITVTDSGSPSESDSSEITINVVETLPVLNGSDSDGDGIADDAEGHGDSDGDGVPNYLDHVAVRAHTLQEYKATANQFLIESEPGVELILGRVALQANNASASVSEDDIGNYGNGVGANEDEHFSYRGGRFDFMVGALPVAGQSVKVVIPQFEVIPSNAVYRKLMRGGWRDFVENERNAVASAAGSEGYCPPAGDDRYSAGLTEGHWCVQLTIEDGGPNDADGVADNTVTDPGGVAQLNSADVEVDGGGGAMGVGSLLLMLLLALQRLRQARTALFASVLLLLSMPAQAWYVGASVGIVKGDESMSSLNQQIADEGITATASSLDDSRSGWKLLAGLPLDKLLAFEASYVDLGDVNARIAGSTTDLQNFFDGIQNVHPITASGLNLGFKWGYKALDIVELNAKVGVFIWDADYEMNASVGSRKVNAHGQGISLGLGVIQTITPQLALRLDVDRYKVDREDVDMWSLGVQYTFE